MHVYESTAVSFGFSNFIIDEILTILVRVEYIFLSSLLTYKAKFLIASNEFSSEEPCCGLVYTQYDVQ